MRMGNEDGGCRCPWEMGMGTRTGMRNGDG